MSSTSPPLTACNVVEQAGECAPGFVCTLEAPPGWAACIVHDGTRACPVGYEPIATDVDDQSLCCPKEQTT
jgi:hypothetical protein